MEQRDYLAISVAGTILLGIVANIGVLAAALAWDAKASVLLALSSMGLAYVSQACASAASGAPSGPVGLVAIACQFSAAVAWVVGLFLLI